MKTCKNMNMNMNICEYVYLLCLIFVSHYICYVEGSRWSARKPLFAAGSDLKHVNKNKDVY